MKYNSYGLLTWLMHNQAGMEHGKGMGCQWKGVERAKGEGRVGVYVMLTGTTSEIWEGDWREEIYKKL